MVTGAKMLRIAPLNLNYVKCYSQTALSKKKKVGFLQHTRFMLFTL